MKKRIPHSLLCALLLVTQTYTPCRADDISSDDTQEESYFGRIYNKFGGTESNAPLAPTDPNNGDAHQSQGLDTDADDEEEDEENDVVDKIIEGKVALGVGAVALAGLGLYSQSGKKASEAGNKEGKTPSGDSKINDGVNAVTPPVANTPPVAKKADEKESTKGVESAPVPKSAVTPAPKVTPVTPASARALVDEKEAVQSKSSSAVDLTKKSIDSVSMRFGINEKYFFIYFTSNGSDYACNLAFTKFWERQDGSFQSIQGESVKLSDQQRVLITSELIGDKSRKLEGKIVLSPIPMKDKQKNITHLVFGLLHDSDDISESGAGAIAPTSPKAKCLYDIKKKEYYTVEEVSDDGLPTKVGQKIKISIVTYFQKLRESKASKSESETKNNSDRGAKQESQNQDLAPTSALTLEEATAAPAPSSAAAAQPVVPKLEKDKDLETGSEEKRESDEDDGYTSEKDTNLSKSWINIPLADGKALSGSSGSSVEITEAELQEKKLSEKSVRCLVVTTKGGKRYAFHKQWMLLGEGNRLLKMSEDERATLPSLQQATSLALGSNSQWANLWDRLRFEEVGSKVTLSMQYAAFEAFYELAGITELSSKAFAKLYLQISKSIEGSDESNLYFRILLSGDDGKKQRLINDGSTGKWYAFDHNVEGNLGKVQQLGDLVKTILSK